MKKLIVMAVLYFAGLSAYAQFVEYQNAYEMRQAQTAQSQTVTGYVPTSNGWVRVTIKVKEAGNTILVVGYKQKDTSRFGGAFATYGNPNPWKSCQSRAQSVSVYSDGREIANNFDYKASISGLGTVYF